MKPISFLLAASLCLLPTLSHAADKATLALEWVIGGGHAPIYLAMKRGYYAAEGIDLTVIPGSGSQKSAALIGSKGATFGITDGPSLVRSVVQGMPLTMVGALANDSPYCVTIRVDSGVKTLKDLVGKRIAFTAGSAQAGIFPAVLSINKIDPDAIGLVNMDPSGAIAAVAANKVIGQLAGMDGQPLVLADMGVQMMNIKFSDVGVIAIGKGIIVNQDTLKQNPDLVRRFLKATQMGMIGAVQSPDEAAQDVLEAQDPMARQPISQIKSQMLINLDLARTPNTQSLPYLWESDKDWDVQLGILKQFGGVTTNLAANSFFTNDLLPK